MKINILIILLFYIGTAAFAKTWIVSKEGTYKFVSEVEALINNNDTLLIQSGIYSNDRQVTFRKNNLLIKGVGSVTLEAGSKIANDQSNGKGIFVVAGNNITIENLTFQNAKVVDENGAGIRQEGCNLKVFNCTFLNNENGILCGTIPNCKTTISYSKFESNGNNGYEHNVYINNIDTLIFTFNECNNAIGEGHELKSRAKFNYIAYNKILNISSVDSRNIDLPNGGTALIVGNIIEQSASSANNNMIGFGLEGLSNPGPHRLILNHNTLINWRQNNRFIHVSNGIDELHYYNNILAGIVAQYVNGIPLNEYKSNNIFEADLSKLDFVSTSNQQYELNANSPAIDKGFEIILAPFDIKAKYLPGIDKKVRVIQNNIDIGAYEFIGPTSTKEENKYSILFYPNPFNDFIFIENTGDVSKITNGNGNNFDIKVIDKNTIDVSQLPKGIYFFQIGGKVFKGMKL